MEREIQFLSFFRQQKSGAVYLLAAPSLRLLIFRTFSLLLSLSLASSRCQIPGCVQLQQQKRLCQVFILEMAQQTRASIGEAGRGRSQQIECESERVSISSTSYEQLFRHQIQTDLAQRTQSGKVGHNFQLSELVKLGILLLVKQKLRTIVLTPIKAAHTHVDEIDPGALNKAFPYLRAPKTHTFQALLGERQQPLPTNTNTFQEKHKKHLWQLYFYLLFFSSLFFPLLFPSFLTFFLFSPCLFYPLPLTVLISS